MRAAHAIVQNDFQRWYIQTFDCEPPEAAVRFHDTYAHGLVIDGREFYGLDRMREQSSAKLIAKGWCAIGRIDATVVLQMNVTDHVVHAYRADTMRCEAKFADFDVALSWTMRGV